MAVGDQLIDIGDANMAGLDIERTLLGPDGVLEFYDEGNSLVIRLLGGWISEANQSAAIDADYVITVDERAPGEVVAGGPRLFMSEALCVRFGRIELVRHDGVVETMRYQSFRRPQDVPREWTIYATEIHSTLGV